MTASQPHPCPAAANLVGRQADGELPLLAEAAQDRALVHRLPRRQGRIHTRSLPELHVAVYRCQPHPNTSGPFEIHNHPRDHQRMGLFDLKGDFGVAFPRTPSVPQ